MKKTILNFHFDYMNPSLIDNHWLSLIIIDNHWLSLIIIDYHWLSLIIIDYHWLSLIILITWIACIDCIASFTCNACITCINYITCITCLDLLEILKYIDRFYLLALSYPIFLPDPYLNREDRCCWTSWIINSNFFPALNWKPYMQKTCDVAEKAILAKKNCGKSA